MSIETGLAGGACAALALAGAAGMMAFRGPSGRWGWIAAGARTVAAILIVVALAFAADSEGGWTPAALRQAALSLALAAIAVHFGLFAGLRRDGAGPVADGAALAVTLVALCTPAAGLEATCPQRSAAFHLEWIPLLLGAGATLVAASGSLVLGLHRMLVRPGRELADLRLTVLAFMRWGTRLSLLALGLGLVVGMWFAWRSAGTLTNGDSREAWMAVTGLISAVSLLAWRLPKRNTGWAAALAVLAAVCAILGLLVLPGTR